MRRGLDLDADIFVFGAWVGLLVLSGKGNQADGADDERDLPGLAREIVGDHDVWKRAVREGAGDDGRRVGARPRFQGVCEKSAAEIRVDDYGARTSIGDRDAAVGLLREVGNGHAGGSGTGGERGLR